MPHSNASYLESKVYVGLHIGLSDHGRRATGTSLVCTAALPAAGARTLQISPRSLCRLHFSHRAQWWNRPQRHTIIGPPASWPLFHQSGPGLGRVFTLDWSYKAFWTFAMNPQSVSRSTVYSKIKSVGGTPHHLVSTCTTWVNLWSMQQPEHLLVVGWLALTNAIRISCWVNKTKEIYIIMFKCNFVSYYPPERGEVLGVGSIPFAKLSSCQCDYVK